MILWAKWEGIRSTPNFVISIAFKLFSFQTPMLFFHIHSTVTIVFPVCFSYVMKRLKSKLLFTYNLHLDCSSQIKHGICVHVWRHDIMSHLRTNDGWLRWRPTYPLGAIFDLRANLIWTENLFLLAVVGVQMSQNIVHRSYQPFYEGYSLGWWLLKKIKVKIFLVLYCVFQWHNLVNLPKTILYIFCLSLHRSSGSLFLCKRG